MKDYKNFTFSMKHPKQKVSNSFKINEANDNSLSNWLFLFLDEIGELGNKFNLQVKIRISVINKFRNLHAILAQNEHDI